MKKIFLFSILVPLIRILNLYSDEACFDYSPVFTSNSITDPPIATSTLADKKDPGRYSARKAFDGNPHSAWVEGKKDFGPGEKIAFHFSKIKKISIIAGYGDPKFFKWNNRISMARFSIFKVAGAGATQCGVTIGLGERVLEMILNFEDRNAYQDFNVTGIPEGNYIGIIEILKVFSGSKWNDTCISEIKTE